MAQKHLTALVLLILLGPAVSRAAGGLCVAQDALNALITDFAYGNRREGRISVFEGEGCTRRVTGPSQMTVDVEVLTRGANGVSKPVKGAARKRALAALSFESDGADIIARLVDRSKLFVDPNNKIASFIYRIRVTRQQQSVASGGVADLEANAHGACGSVIALRSPMDGSLIRVRRGAYSARAVPDAAALAGLGTLHLEGLFEAPHHAAVFSWKEGTGGQRVNLDIILTGPGGAQTTTVSLVNPCKPPALSPAARPVKVVVDTAGTMTRLKVGYPYVGVALGTKSVTPDSQWAFSIDYDFDYVHDRGDLPWAHILSMDFRSAPTNLDGLSLAASVAVGMHVSDADPALYFAPKVVLSQREVPVQVATGMFGTWDGEVGYMNGVFLLEYVSIW